MSDDASAHRAAPLLLASGSVYRRALLSRLRLPFTSVNPAIDESRRSGEPAERYVARLAQAKAAAAAAEHPAHLIVGADQAAVGPDGALFGKPGERSRALRQLEAMSGREIRFLTAACLRRPDGSAETHVDVTRVLLRRLTLREIEAYLDAEQPLDCAGAFKAEGLGIALFERIDSRDPTALLGLPLIWLAGALRRAGVPVP